MPIRDAGVLPDNFPEPETFKPERWSRKNKDTPNVFASLPFGFGIRMCVGELPCRMAAISVATVVTLGFVSLSFPFSLDLNATLRSTSV